jgi:hypothetical protein
MTKENGKDIMYIKLTKALYGTLQAAMLFWRDLTGYLTQDGFVLNPYDNCVVNKMINGTQCTILWHVDDLKILHAKQAVLEDLIDMLNERYGKLEPLTVTRGDIHDYLGMTLDYSTPGQVSIRMNDYISNLFEEAPANMAGTATTPATDHLFSMNESPKHLDDMTSELFHHLTAKLLFQCKRTRPNIQTAVAFLMTCVKRPDKDDYKKRGRVIKYLHATPTMALTLEGVLSSGGSMPPLLCILI